jgi:antagonist of KipI
VSTMVHVAEPGLLTTIQDLGRLTAMAGGVSPGGAMDRFAHSAANLLVGNDPHDAALECTVRGPTLVARDSCLVAVTGADLDPRVNGAPAPAWTGIRLEPGDRLSFEGRRQGARAYVAFAGGLDADRWLGSRSTDLMACRGGLHGRPLKAGDLLATRPEAGSPVTRVRSLAAGLRPDYSDHSLAAMPGPHHKRLDAAGRRRLFGGTFRLTRHSDRMGYRLEGPQLDSTGEELLSFGLVAGAVQVPRSGQPILLMADHQTAGGYPVVATVISAAMPQAAQLMPGDEVRFVETTATEARLRRAALNEALATLR